jgi:hypothetical protein
VVWVIFDPSTLELGPFLWFGGLPGERLPDVRDLKVARHTKGNAQGVKQERPNMRVLPKGRFEKLGTMPDLLLRLFGPLHPE